MKKILGLLALLLVIGCGTSKINYRTSSEEPVGYANIYSNGHGIIYSSYAEAQANSEGRIAFAMVKYIKFLE